MGLFTKDVRITISEETKNALASLDDDVQALVGLVDELVATHTNILTTIKGDIFAVVEAAHANGELSVIEKEAFSTLLDEQSEGDNGTATVKPPDEMRERTDWESETPEEQRVRATPFTRAPRHTQVAWLKEVMADGKWYAPVQIARDTANDERHFRYLRHAVAGRLREMHEENIVVRRDSHVKGSMFEYRLNTPLQDLA